MTGKQQVIRLLYPVNISTLDSANLNIIRDDKVRRINFRICGIILAVHIP